MKKPVPGKAQIIWGVILFFVPFFSDGSWVYNDVSGEATWQTLEWVRWVGIGLIVYGFMKNSRESKD